MGASASSTMETISETVNKTTVDILNRNENDARQSGITEQESKIEGLSVIGCELDISQESTVTLKAMQSITSEVSSTIISDIAAALEAKGQTVVKAESSLASQPANSAAVTKAVTSVKNEMSANLTTENINKIIQNVNMQQKQNIKDLKYDACGVGAQSELLKMPGIAGTKTGEKIADSIASCLSKTPKPKCNISQITTVNLVADQITKSVMAIIANNKAVNDVKTDFKAQADAKGKGLGEMIGDIFKGLFGGLFGGMANMAGMAFFCCCCCCCLLLLLGVGGSMMPKGGGGASGANAGANAAQNATNGGFSNNGGGRGIGGQRPP